MSGPKTDNTGQIQKREPSKADSLVGLIERMLPQIKNALPKHVSPDRMARIAMTAVRQTPDLALCTTASFVGCVMQAAQLGLEPNTPLGYAWLIPRKNKKLDAGQRECTLLIGYQGRMDLARRAGVPIRPPSVVREGDFFEYEKGTAPTLRHKESDDPNREDKPITHAYAVGKVDGEPVFVVLTRGQIEKRRQRSQAADDGPWVTDYAAMCLKTAVHELSKWLPKSAEMARAEALEDAADRGSQASALDPFILEKMASNGLIEDGEIIDAETGEVTKATVQNGGVAAS